MRLAFSHITMLAATVALAAAVVGCSSSSAPETPPPPDTFPPNVVSVTATRFHRVEVVFNERVDEARAENPSSYFFTDVTAASSAPLNAASAVEIMGAELQQDARTVYLTCEPVLGSAAFELSITGIMDLKGNVLEEITKPVKDDIKSGKIYTIAGTGIPALGRENIDPRSSDLYLPQDITVGPDGFLYVVDWNNHRIRVIKNGRIRTIIGSGILGDANPGVALNVGLNHPTNVCFDGQGKMYMAAWHNSKIMVYDMASGYLDVYVGKNGARWWEGDGGPAVDAVVNLPSSVAIGPNDDNLYISDQANFCVRMVDRTDGTISTVVAKGQCSELGMTCEPGFCGDNDLAVNACLDGPRGQAAAPASRLEFDRFGNLYLTDTKNQRVRKVDAASKIITTVAGSGVKDHTGDGGDAAAAGMNNPSDVAIGPDDNLYIADKDNHCIRMVDQAGLIWTVAGIGKAPGFAGDGGPADKAQLFEPYGVTLDAEGNLYIADTGNHRIRVVYR